MLGDTVEAALEKMMMKDQHQHSDSLLQEFYAMTQRDNKPMCKYAYDSTWRQVRYACSPGKLWVTVRKRGGDC